MPAQGTDPLLRFRLLIDDVAETRFDDTQAIHFLTMAQTDVINDLMGYGFEHGIVYEVSNTVTILSGSEFVKDWSPNGVFLYPTFVRRNETNDKSYIPLLPKELSMQGDTVSVWFQVLHGGGISGEAEFRLGYYREATKDMKFQITGIIQSFGVQVPNLTPDLPTNIHNLIVYKAAAIASPTDTDRLSVWEVHYQNNMRAFGQVLRKPLTQVVDVYGDN